MAQRLSNPGIVTVILLLQIIPIIIYPLATFSIKTQEWWLPVLLVIMVLAADFQIIVRRTTSLAPWYLLAFAQGFNLISRLMMVWSHSTTTVAKVNQINSAYLLITFVAMAMSIFMLWYCEQPSVRMAYLEK